MISLPQGFRIGGLEAVDSRLSLTKAEMKAMKDGNMPQTYFAVCKDDGKIYIYDKNYSVNEATGKFIPFDEEIKNYIQQSISDALLEIVGVNTIGEDDGTILQRLEAVEDTLMIEPLQEV